MGTAAAAAAAARVVARTTTMIGEKVISLLQPTAIMSAPCPAAWLLVVLLQLTPSLTSTSISPSSSSSSSSISSFPYGSPRDALLWRADAVNAQGPHYRQYLSSPLKLLGGGVPVPATPSQKMVAASRLRTLTGLKTVVNPRERLGQRFLAAGRKEDIEARIRQQTGSVSRPQSERPEQGLLEIELH